MNGVLRDRASLVGPYLLQKESCAKAKTVRAFFRCFASLEEKWGRGAGPSAGTGDGTGLEGEARRVVGQRAFE